MALLLNQGDVVLRSYSYTKPSPTHPIQPEFVGVRTGNLFDDDNAEFGKWVNSNGSIATNATYAAGYDIKVGTASEFAIKYYGNKPYSYSMAFYDSNGDFLSRVHRSSPSASYDAFSVPENAVSARFQVACDTSTIITSAILKAMKLMLNSGSTALPYEPYGWAEKFTCAGQTVPVYLGQTQTVRRIKKMVFDGTEGWINNSNNACCVLYISPIGFFMPTDSLIVCTHMKKANKQEELYLRQVDYGITFGGAAADRICIRNKDCEPVADFKAWLASEYANGTPVTVWYVLETEQTGIVNEPLAKIGDYADELHSTDAAVTIPTVKGQNTLTVDTALAPSSLTIKGHVKEMT